MNVHEYQAKDLLRRFGIRILAGGVARSPEEAAAIAKGLSGGVAVVKAQIHAGGRGKGRFKEHPDLGGVKVLDKAEVKATAARMLDSTLVTIQTGDEGRVVKKVLVEEGCAIAHEYYAAVTVDRAARTPAIMVSAEGGVDIEEVAAETPERIFSAPIDPTMGLHPFQARELARKLGLRGGALRQGADLLVGLARAFLDTDAALLEINPMVLTEGGDVVALDAKMSFDDNGLPRHPEIAEMRDPEEESPEEQEAERHDLSYISLDGTIGCMVNGAGLAMATMDMIKHAGGEPANFLDVGGGASEERITAAFKIIVSDPNVKALLVNIFGGILRCDLLAQGVVAAAKTIHLAVPLVVRLEGTNVEEGRQILADSGLPIHFCPTLAEAAERAVAAARGDA